jgi:hypothetical protein
MRVTQARKAGGKKQAMVRHAIGQNADLPAVASIQDPRQTGVIPRHGEIREPFPVFRTAPKIAAR